MNLAQDQPDGDNTINTSNGETIDSNGVPVPLKLVTNGDGPRPTNGQPNNESVDSDTFFDIDLINGPGGVEAPGHPHSQPVPPPRHHSPITHTSNNAAHSPSNTAAYQQHNAAVSTPITFYDTSVDSVSLSSSEGTYFDLDGTVGDGESSTDSVTSTCDRLSSSLSHNDYFDCDEVDCNAHHQQLMFNSTAAHVADSKPSAGELRQLQSSPVIGGRAPSTFCVAADREADSSDSGSESLPVSQSTSMSSTATVTGNDTDTFDSSALDETMQKQTLLELCLLSEQQQRCSSDVDAEETLETGDEKPSAEQQHPLMNSDDDTTQSSTDTDELLAVDPELQCALEHRDNEEILDAADREQMVVNEDTSCSTVGGRHHDGNPVSNSSSSSSIDEEVRPQKLRRCSSLKSGKTPPGTPGTKKFVRFADVLGLDLADVKTFMDEIPTVPRSAYDYLTLSSDDEASTAAAAAQASVYASLTASFQMDKMLTPMFQQPGGMVDFLERVREQNVCLENAAVTDPICLTISGTVRVRNLDFHKSVHLRYTLDEWASFADFQALYVEQSCDGFSDKFTFTIFGNSLRVGQRLEMAVRFSCKGEQFWDSNYGANYCFQCVPAGPVVTAMPSPEGTSPTMTPVRMDSNLSRKATMAANDDEADMLFY